MAEQSNGHTSTGTHRTNREFAEQLTTWGFAQRKIDGVHLVLRGPHGGTLRMVRSLLGQADLHCVTKAARLVGVTVERFWAGPDGLLPAPPSGTRAASPTRPAPTSDRDRVTSLVLGVHAEADRPLGFNQVVELAGTRVTREQVRAASAQLCREGDLDRIRSGVYQWSGGARSGSRPTTPVMAALPARQQVQSEPATSAAALFDQLFPSGVRMNAELLADFERWAELTEKLAQHALAS